MAKKKTKKAKPKRKKAKVKAKRKKALGCSSRTFNVRGAATATTFTTKSCTG